MFDEQPTELLSQQHAVQLRLLETMRLNTNTTYVFCIFRTSNIKFQLENLPMYFAEILAMQSKSQYLQI